MALPALWYSCAAGAFAAALAWTHHLGMHEPQALPLAWAGSIATALLMGRLAVRMKPDLRFSTRGHTEGLGYVHQPFDAVVNVTLTAGVAWVVCHFFKG